MRLKLVTCAFALLAFCLLAVPGSRPAAAGSLGYAVHHGQGLAVQPVHHRYYRRYWRHHRRHARRHWRHHRRYWRRHHRYYAYPPYYYGPAYYYYPRGYYYYY